MKTAIFWFLILAFFMVLVGCREITSDQAEIIGEKINGTQPNVTPLATKYLITPSPPESPYPQMRLGSGEPTIPTMTSSPAEENDLTGRDTSTGDNQVPTAHVDVILRATDPEAFVLASGGYQFVEFFAFWCPTCKSMTPVLRNLEHKYKDKIRFIYLDIDDPKTNPIKQALGFQYQPHFFLLDGEGKVIKQWIGYVTEEELDALLGSFQ